MRRVVITGLGAISALGRNAAEFWTALEQGRSGIGPIEGADRSKLRFQNGAEVHGYDSADYFEPKQADYIDRFAQFGVVAAREAIRDSGIVWTDENRESTAIGLTGSCVGGQEHRGHRISWICTCTRKPRVNPLTIPLHHGQHRGG